MVASSGIIFGNNFGNKVAAFEYRRIQGLAADPQPGLKLLLVEPWVRRGILLLSSENTTVLGGEVRETGTGSNSICYSGMWARHCLGVTWPGGGVAGSLKLVVVQGKRPSGGARLDQLGEVIVGHHHYITPLVFVGDGSENNPQTFHGTRDKTRQRRSRCCRYRRSSAKFVALLLVGTAPRSCVFRASRCLASSRRERPFAPAVGATRSPLPRPQPPLEQPRKGRVVVLATGLEPAPTALARETLQALAKQMAAAGQGRRLRGRSHQEEATAIATASQRTAGAAATTMRTPTPLPRMLWTCRHHRRRGIRPRLRPPGGGAPAPATLKSLGSRPAAGRTGGRGEFPVWSTLTRP